MLIDESEINPTTFVLDWLKRKTAENKAMIQQIPLHQLTQWYFSSDTGNILHKSGRFFSIDGIHIETNWGGVPVWEQPIINQPEIGCLGILTKNIKGVLHFLVQAKIEPGNINKIQLSPTLQATKSNYTRVHKGKSPPYLEYFTGDKNAIVLVDQLQSEQGSRFLKKRNRNIILEIPENEDIPENDNFIWLTLGQIKKLISHDNTVNMDTRTVISGIHFGSYNHQAIRKLHLSRKINFKNPVNYHLTHSLLNGESYLNDFNKIASWITGLKSKFELDVNLIPLKNVKEWKYDGISYNHEEKKYFSVIGLKVEIGNREVALWDQPMISPVQEGLIAFIVKEINGVYHFLVQAKLEAGNFDVLEFAPTVQCLTGNYREGSNEYSVPFVDYVLSAPKKQIWYSAMQSEEGGRFYKEQNLNIIVEAGDDFSVKVPENYCWMTLNQLLIFIRFNNYLNISARSLISAVMINNRI